MARAARLIGAAADLAEGGAGIRFDWIAPGGKDRNRGFAIRYDGEVRAFANRCPHLGVELDWQPGEFFDESGLYLICSTHGAVFEPSSGLCLAGPCRGARLPPIAVEEREGRIFIDDEVPETVPGDPSQECP